MIPIKSIWFLLPSVSKHIFSELFIFGVQPNKSSGIQWNILQECQHVGLISKNHTNVIYIFAFLQLLSFSVFNCGLGMEEYKILQSCKLHPQYYPMLVD